MNNGKNLTDKFSVEEVRQCIKDVSYISGELERKYSCSYQNFSW